MSEEKSVSGDLVSLSEALGATNAYSLELAPEVPVHPLAPLVKDPDEFEEEQGVSAEATVVLPASEYVPWKKRITPLLTKAENGYDYTAKVMTTGPDSKGRPQMRIHWRALTPAGVEFLRSIVATFKLIQTEFPKQLGQDKP